MSAGVKGSGSRLAGRPIAQRRGRDTGRGRRILSVAGPSVRGRERTVFLGPVVADRMDPDDLPITVELHQAGDDANWHRPSAPTLADPVAGRAGVSST